jgi:hypothetical protein
MFLSRVLTLYGDPSVANGLIRDGTITYDKAQEAAGNAAYEVTH